MRGILRYLPAFSFLLWASGHLHAQMPEASAEEPLLTFSFPLGGQKGTKFEIEVTGRGLTGAYAVWTGVEDLTGRILKIEEIKPEEKKIEASQATAEAKPPGGGQRVLLEVVTRSLTLPGAHDFRLVCPRGITNALTLQVSEQPVVSEKAEVHDQPEWAQALDLPALVNGQLKEPGEVDYYSLEASSGQELVMEVGCAGRKLNPTLTLFDPSGSWFDPKRLKRIAFNDDVSYRTRGSKLIHRFASGGKYLVAVGAFVGLVESASSYQLRIAPVNSVSSSDTEQLFTETPARPETTRWNERSFVRPLRADILRELWRRNVQVPGKELPQVATSAGIAVESPGLPRRGTGLQDGENPALSPPLISVLKEKEPNDALAQAMEINLPLILEGAIATAGDVDSFSFSVRGAQAVAFELETPLETPNRFNPRFAILDAAGRELAVNIYSRLGGDGDDWLLSPEPKLTYLFERDGKYQLQVSDSTVRRGGSRFVYRLLVRPQIAHVGAVEVLEDRANLIVGKAKKLTVIVEQEEGYSGDVLIDVEGLPPGVKCFAAAEVEPVLGPALEKIHPERYLPKKQKVNLMLMAQEGTPLTRLPSLARVNFRPIVGGNPGQILGVKEIPVMVLSAHKDSETF